MKVIVNEEQFKAMKRIWEDMDGDDESVISEYPGSEVSAQPTIRNSSDEIEYAEPVKTDDVSDKLTPQSWRSNYRQVWGRG